MVRKTRVASASRGHRQRGAALVEFGIVFPLLFMLVSGMIDFGLAFTDLNSTRQGVREGARQAVVANFGDDTSCPVSGTVANDTVRKAICLTKDRVGLSEVDTRVKIVFPGTNQVGDSLLVCVQRPLDSATGVFDPVLGGRALTAMVEMRIEKVDPLLVAAEETPLSGTSWSWCS
jgi:hypothetical protein